MVMNAAGHYAALQASWVNISNTVRADEPKTVFFFVDKALQQQEKLLSLLLRYLENLSCLGTYWVEDSSSIPKHPDPK